MPTPQQVHPSQKFKIERSVEGGITILDLHGVIDEGFEGQRVADTVRTKKLVVSLRDVRRFASWGMSEWMNFLRAIGETDLYFVECSTYAINQMNLVTGLLGQGKLVSFYSPFRCGSCGEEFETLTVVPLEHATLRELGDSEKVCLACGGRARMDKYPAQMHATLADRPIFDIDDEVVALLRGRYKYDVTPNTTRFRAVQRVIKGHTYTRLTGNVGTLQPAQLASATTGTTILDLAGIVFDPTQLQAWTAYLAAALPTVTSLQLLDCPPGFLENAVTPADLQGKLKVRSFGLAYHCAQCNASTTYIVDVAPNLEQLTEGMVPNANCPTCKALMLAPLTHEQLELIRRLPARENDVALERFLAKARAEPSDKLDDAMVARPALPPKPPAGATRALYFASGLAVLVVAGLVLVAVPLWKQTDAPVAPVAGTGGVVAPTPNTSQFQRPDWITSDVPSSSFCQDAINRIVCVGVSSYRPDRGDAVAEASDAALDELVNAVGLKIAAPMFRDDVLAGYSKVRANALSTLQSNETDRTTPTYLAASDVVRKARRSVVELLKSSGGAAVPAQRSDWYWEEYNREKGAGTEFRVFVRYDVCSTRSRRWSTPTRRPRRWLAARR